MKLTFTRERDGNETAATLKILVLLPHPYPAPTNSHPSNVVVFATLVATPIPVRGL